MKKSIAVIGSSGFVGSALIRELKNRGTFKVLPIGRNDDTNAIILKADYVIHTANPAARFFAKKNPEIDFNESVEKTFSLKKLAKKKKFILISSISARTQLDTVYGRNRRACECLMNEKENLIIRLGPMFGGNKEVGALHDILKNDPVFVSEKTKYAFVNVSYNAKKIIDLIDENGLIELGAKNAIELSELKNILGSSSEFSGDDDTQIAIDPQPDAPDVNEVIEFARKIQTNSI